MRGAPTRRYPPRVGERTPSWWLARDMLDKRRWLRRLAPAERSVLMAVAHGATPRREQLAGLLTDIRCAVVDGPGFLIVRGGDLGDIDVEAAEHLVLAFSSLIGDIGTQTRDGATIRHVTNHGRGDRQTTTIRGHTTRAALGFHTDSSDVAVLLCVRQSTSGGETLVASSAAVHDLMLDRAPELTAELYQRQHFHMSAGNPRGAPPTFLSPVFARTDLGFSCRYSSQVLRSAPQVIGLPLGRKRLAAFDLLDATADDEAVHLRTRLEPGDIQLVNNYLTLHARTGYPAGHNAHERLLLRVWVKVPRAARRHGRIEHHLRHGWIPDEAQLASWKDWQPTPATTEAPWTL